MTTDSTHEPQPAAPSDIEDRVLKVIATTKRIPRESVTVDSSFEALGIDSLDRLNILFDLESEFDIQINDEDAKRVETIRQMIAGVVQLVQNREAGEAVSAAAAESTGTAPAVEAVKQAAASGHRAPTPTEAAPASARQTPMTKKPASSEE